MSHWRSRFAVAVLSGAAVAGGFFGGATLLDHVQFARAESAVEEGRQQLSHAEDLSSVFRDVAKVMEPSVVQIKVVKTIHMQGGDAPDDNLLRKFFQDNGQDAPQMPDRDFEQDGTGSGVIMETADGY